MDNRSFSAQNSYDFASDVNMNVVTKIKESYNIFKGVNIITDYVRTYN